jgi:L,D-transpeptidase YbiS
MLTAPSTEERWLHVHVPTQKLWFKEEATVLWEALVSTSRFGLGEEEGSQRTPRGWHRIVEIIGQEAPLGTQFKARKPTGYRWSPTERAVDEDLILTRLFWLSGEEPQNANSQRRYIYLHGTNQEHLLGTPASAGCVRLGNEDSVTLATYVRVGTRVWIEGGEELSRNI